MTDEITKPLGYTDTPIIPGTCWRVHDGGRPQPRVVTPGTFSTQETPGPPSDIIYLMVLASAAETRTIKQPDGRLRSYMEVA